MKTKFQNRLLIAAVLATSAPFVLSATAFAQPGQSKEQREDKQKKAKEARAEAAAARQQAREKEASAAAHQRQAAAAGNAAERQRHQAAAAAARQQQVQAGARARQQEAVANQAARQEARHDRQMATTANQAARQENRAERQQAQAANQAARQDARSDRQDARQARRLDRAQQTQLITAQKQRVSQYRAWQQAQRTAAQRAAAAVQAQNRSAQYAYISDYNNRLWQQQQRYATMSFDWYNDPYFYMAPSYRYMRDGRYYTINQYGANLLQQAINDGYNEGYHAGRADRMDGWRADYRSSWVYQNASYGYNGYYLDRSEYNYYFRQGFRRGYEDGYYGRYQYGTRRDGKYMIIGAVLNTILGLQSYNRY